MFNKISFIGAGSMAESIIAGILEKRVVTNRQIFVTNKRNHERLANLQHRFNINGTTNKENIIDQADLIILSTKPYDMEEAIDSIKAYMQPNQFVVSVAAGISTEFIAEKMEMDVSVVRVMPNTSASIGFSATAIAGGKHAKQEHIKLVEKLFKTIGTTTIVAEEDMHAVTSISGSGPAYIYYLVEAMEQAAVEAGLDKDVAKALITQTVVGAGEMLKKTDDPVRVLREKITSPGGTTQAAIETLDANDFKKTIFECVNSARQRSIELGETY
ncbi:pyrroline-5-carboxylate reductase [Virgibacillus oceani]|uniref:Pyrroline-5-carboxylate reductase n=1 Tax=Virgibacillus oceani TaxID=1479511 RepID=A0A917HKW6_9BACI|nr:pyrroline-5-carboxylate reductase [Virgibacillus oceani]GGG82473.1 pyrroline-5-carboxylate reductase [Virgibacillus oceani]